MYHFRQSNPSPCLTLTCEKHRKCRTIAGILQKGMDLTSPPEAVPFLTCRKTTPFPGFQRGRALLPHYKVSFLCTRAVLPPYKGILIYYIAVLPPYKGAFIYYIAGQPPYKTSLLCPRASLPQHKVSLLCTKAALPQNPGRLFCT